MKYQLAEVNIAYMKASQDDPLLADFVARLDEINRLAELSEGFVWRYVSDTRDPSAREYDDPLVLFNMSVWRDAASLHTFTYRTAHAELFAKRAKWFDDVRERIKSRGLALWWVPAGIRPTVDDAKIRLSIISSQGPTPQAFNFKTFFGPDGNRVTPEAGSNRALPA